MIWSYIKILFVVFGSILLISCGGGVKRVNGEMAFDAKSLINLANTFLKAGDYNNALRLYKRAANENPKNIPSRLGLANTYKALGSTEAALNFYDQVLQIDQGNKVARMGTGEMLITKNRPANALTFLIKLSKENPKDHRIYNLIGLAYDLLGRQEAAQMNYARGLTVAPNNISLLNNLALSLAFQKQYAPSIRLLSKAINLDYSVTKARYNLVMVYVLSGEEQAGRKIGTPLMTAGELENKIKHFRWIKSLTPKQQAQAIFLGIKYFPGDIKEGGREKKKSYSAKIQGNISGTSKKRQLMEVLKQEKSHPDVVKEVSPTEIPKKINNSKLELSTQSAKKVKNNLKSISNSVQKIYRVQLGSYANIALAHRGWQKIISRSKAILIPYKPLIKQITLANGKNLFRLFVGDIEARMIARTVCDNLHGEKVDCLVLKTSR